VEDNTRVTLYSGTQVRIATFFGGPLAGCILMARNYGSLARPDKAGPCLIIGFISTIALIVAAFLLPESFPNIVLPLLSVVVMHQWHQGTQEAEYKRFIGDGGQRASYRPVAFVSVSCLVGILLVIFAMLLVGSGGALFDDYGQRLEFNGGELYYAPDVTEEQARSLGRYLVKTDFFDNTPKSVRITRSGAVYAFHIVVAPEGEKNPLLEIVATHLGRELSADVFDNAPVEVHICDEYFQTLIQFPAVAGEDAGSDSPASRGSPTGGGLPAQRIYVVRSGDTLSAIARKHGVTVEALQSLNRISDPNKISVGMRLEIPTKRVRD